MSGFEDLPQAIDQGAALQPILPEEVAFADEGWSDEDALGIVLQDVVAAEAYLTSKNILSNLDRYDNLYAAEIKKRTWPGTEKPKSALSMPVVLEAIEKILPTLHRAIWGSGRDPFILEPVGRTKPETARARAKILSWAMKQAGLKEESRLMLKTVLQYGLTVGSYGWKSQTKEVKRWELKEDGSGDVEVKKVTVEINVPTFECLSLRNILIDPGCMTQSIPKSARFFIKRITLTGYELDDLRDNAAYKNIPSREELAQILATRSEPTENSLSIVNSQTYRELQAERDTTLVSADPLLQNLEILEYWTPDRVVAVLQRKIVIRNEDSEFGVLPFPSCSFIDVLGSAWGFGVAKLLSGEQIFQAGVINQWIDSFTLTMTPMFQLSKGIGPGSQNISVRPGGVISENGKLEALVQPDLSTPALNAVAVSEERAARRVGANGGSDMPTQALRTGTGVNTVQQDIAARLQYFLEIFLDLVFVPTLEAFIELCKRLSPKQLNDILTEEDGKPYEGDNILDIYNCQTKIKVLAGTNLAARVAVSQIAPMIMTMVASQPVHDALTVAGKMFDLDEWLTMLLDLNGLPVSSLIKKLDPQQEQRSMMMNQAASQAVADQQRIQQEHQNDLEAINEKGTVQAGVAVVKQAVKSGFDHGADVLKDFAANNQPSGGQVGE